MADRPETLVALIAGVRRRWVTLAWLGAFARAAAGSVVLTATALVAYMATRPEGLPLVALAAIVLVGIVVLFLLSGVRLRRRPTDLRVARFIEEQIPDLDDSLVTAVEFGTAGDAAGSSAMLASLLHDANRRAADVHLDDVVARATLRRSWLLAGGTALLLALAMFVSRAPARRAFDAASVHVLPWRVAIEVAPGNARVRAGEPVTISVRLTGAGSVLSPVLRVEGSDGRDIEMKPDGGDDRFTLTMDEVRESFSYRVAAGAISSPSFTITALRAPRVSRIDLRYHFPSGLGLTSRTEEDSGDIYAPAGTRVEVRVRADKPVTEGELAMADGRRLPLAAIDGDLLQGELLIAQDGSYRVSLSDQDGLESQGETEYFIRTLDDRPPDVRIVTPGSDRKVTQLEEVPIAARAEDDYGIERFELVYAVRGRAETVIPLERRAEGTAVSGTYTMFLEELDVRPGDFVTYYARARDVARGRRSTEGRSDIFFLEVKPYDEEFASADSQSMGGANSRAVEELSAAQKEIIIATWKLDRRSLSGRSKQDILSVAAAQDELRERAAGMVRQFNRFGRDGRRRAFGDPAPEPADDPMSLAVEAMSRAGEELGRLKTSPAIPHEMEALNQLLRAEAEVRRRQVARQQSNGGGSGSNRSTQDLSALFDRELRRQQETNYETPTSAATQDPDAEDEGRALDRIRELARRQDELARQQRDLAKDQAGLSADELKRRLERLTREQSELRRQTEELSRQLAQQKSAEQKSAEQRSADQRSQQQGDQQQGGQQAQQSPSGQQGGGGEGQSALSEASEEMRGAASDLRRQNPGQASARSGRALERLRSLERQMQTRQPDDRRRALGDLQLEARQLADSQRQIQAELQRDGAKASPDALRRLAGEKEQLAERVERFERSVGDLEPAMGSPDERQALGDVTGELDRQQIDRRLRESADGLRQDASATPDAKGRPAKSGRGPQAGDKAPGQSGTSAGRAAERLQAERELTRAFERVAERMGSAAGERDGESRELSDQLARTRELKEQLSELERQMAGNREDGADKGQEGGSSKTGKPASGPRGSSNGQNATDPDDRARLRDEYVRQLQEAQKLLGSSQGQGPQEGGRGGTPEHWEPSVSAPGTEAFKQDFSQWETLRRDVTLALERLEASLSSRLQDIETRDRLSAGADTRAPESYQRLVDEYFRSLASKTNP